MIFLSALPDSILSLWQAKAYLNSLKKLNIDKERIHILIGFDKSKGLNKDFETFVYDNGDANVYLYEDTRKDMSDRASFRPNLFKKHFGENPWLSDAGALLTDSGVIFLKEPALKNDDQLWYCPGKITDEEDNRPIFQHRILWGKIGKVAAIDIGPMIAQYKTLDLSMALVKRTDYGFWDEVENNSVAISSLLKKMDFPYPPPTADIAQWISKSDETLENLGFLAAAIKRGIKFATTKELEYARPKDQVSHWSEKKIYYDVGVRPEDLGLFNKDKYLEVQPFNASIRGIDTDRCSSKYLKVLTEIGENKDRIDLPDTTFIIIVKIDSQDRLENLDISVRYLSKYFRSRIAVFEIDDIPRVNHRTLPDGVEYRFIHASGQVFHRTRCINFALREVKSQVAIIYDCDVIAEPDSILEAVHLITKKACVLAYPYDGTFINLPRYLLKAFSLEPDISLLKKFHFLHEGSHRRSVGGAFAVAREAYLNCGGENENFESWGREDMERAKRISILGFPYARTGGFLYHMEHFVGMDSGTLSTLDKNNKDLEYLKICSMEKKQLEQYISNWK